MGAGPLVGTFTDGEGFDWQISTALDLAGAPAVIGPGPNGSDSLTEGFFLQGIGPVGSFSDDVVPGAAIGSSAQMGLRYFIATDTPQSWTTAEAGREINFDSQTLSGSGTNGTTPIAGIDVTRSVYVPDATGEGWVRVLDTVTNNAGSAQTFLLFAGGGLNNLNSQTYAEVATSSGDTVWSTGDHWIIQDDTSSPDAGNSDNTPMLFVYGDGSLTPSFVGRTVSPGSSSGSDTIWDNVFYTVTLAAGASISFLFFAAQGSASSLQSDDVPDLTDPGAAQLVGLSQAEIGRIANFSLASVPTVSGLPASLFFTEDTEDALDLSASSFADLDSATISVTLSLSSGRILLAAPGGIPVTRSGNATSAITIAGAPSAIDAYLDIPTNTIYAPAANFEGTATLTVTADDGGGAVTLGTSQIIVTAVDDPAVAYDDAFSITESEAIGGAGASLFNANGGLADSDPDGTFLITAVAGVTVGTQFTLASGALLTVNANGTFAYDPNGAFDELPAAGSGAANVSATDSFSYTITGGDTATVTITITGEASDLDVYLGTPGPDTILGGAGRDLFRGSPGADSYDGAGGIDYISYAGSTAGVTVNLTTSVNLGGDAEGDTLVSIDHVTGSVFADDITGNGGSNHLNGGAGADTLRGLGGSDFYFVDDALDLVVEDAVPGADTVIATVSFVLGANLERLALRGTDDLDGTGNGLANLITGNDGANILTGLGGNDALLGGAGEDTLDGGEGSDRLTGGADADIFIFSAASDTRAGVLRDRILDFVTGEDMIDLSAIDADIRAGSPNDQAFDFIGGARFSGGAHEIRTQTILGQTVIQGDIDGDRRTDFEIGLAGFAGTLAVGDFML